MTISCCGPVHGDHSEDVGMKIKQPVVNIDDGEEPEIPGA